MNMGQSAGVKTGVTPDLETGDSGGSWMNIVRRTRVSYGSDADAILPDRKRSSVCYSALVTRAFDPEAVALGQLSPVTRSMRMTDAARDTSDAARLAGQSFARWLADPMLRHQFHDAFDGMQSSLLPDERTRRLSLLLDEVAGLGNAQDPYRFAPPVFVTAGEPGGDPAALTELPPESAAALLAVRRAPSMILLSAALGFSEMVNLATHMYAAAIAHHASYLGLALDPSAVGEKLARAAGARPINATWSFIQLRLRSVPTYAIGLQLQGPAAP
jgi:hypothetical protein